MAIKVANNQSLTAITALPAAVSGGAMNLLETQTASSSSTISFTSNIDDTYDEYVFKFYDIHPATDAVDLTFQADTGTNTNYNQSMTTTLFQAAHDEADSSAAVGYQAGIDQAGTAFQRIGKVGNGNDECCVGILHLFAPSSSVFVKHFFSNVQNYHNENYSTQEFTAGYFNTTTALTRVQFKMSSGNIDAGVIKLYGIS
jgi:hypothetical protein